MLTTNLEEFVKQVEEIGRDINFDHEFIEFDFRRIPQARQWMQAKYYRMLSAVAYELQPGRILEIGTFFGGSALALSRYGAHVITYDIEYKVVDPNIFRRRNISFRLCDDDHYAPVKVDYSKFDLIFVDCGHSGPMEIAIHENLCKSYKGLVLWDDINWKGMRPFWDSITQPKIETDWHNPDGFGVVLYGYEKEIQSQA